MWKVLRQIAADTTVYYKQLNIFLAVALVIFAIVWARPLLKSAIMPQAATQLPATLLPQEIEGGGSYAVELDRSGRLFVNRKELHGALSFTHDQTQFLLVLVRDAPVPVSSLTATIHLPVAVKDPKALNPRIFAVHGVGSAFYKIIDNRTIRFEATEIAPGAEVSLGLSFPRNYFNLSLIDRLRSQVGTLTPQSWLILGTVLPGIAILFLLFILLKHAISSLRVSNDQTLNSPPSPLPPAVIGALYHGRIAKKEITATFFDLAERGFITLHQNEAGALIFGKGTNLFNTNATALRPFEVFLLHQIFGEEEFAASAKDVEFGISNELFSSKVAMTIMNIYDETVAHGFFLQSPNSYYLRYKLGGMLLFFIAVIALLYGAFTLPEPAYVLFFWVGMIAASLLIIAATPGLPRRTKVGDDTLRQWMAFRNYLTMKQSINNPVTDQFLAYLPYAIVLDCEDAWVKRWQKEVIVLPPWFSADKVPYTSDDYRKTLISVIDFLSKHLVTSRPPNLA